MIIFNANSKQAVINNKNITLEYAPYFYNTFFMLPIRTVAEGFGWAISFENTKTVLRRGPKTIEIILNSNEIRTNGVTKYTNNANRVIAGRTFVQADVVLPLMDLYYTYSSTTKQFIITSSPLTALKPDISVSKPKFDYQLLGLGLIGYWLLTKK